MRHTPGPWHVDPDPRPDMEWNNHIYGADGMAVCFMAHSDGKDDERDEANARLIAAAPDLLSALEAVEQAYSNRHSPQHRTACLMQAQAAIKKAKGES